MRWTLPALVVTVLLAGAWAVWTASHPPLTPAEAAFVEAVRTPRGGDLGMDTAGLTDSQLIANGRAYCVDKTGGFRFSDLTERIRARSRVINNQTSGAILFAADEHLCPDVPFVSPAPTAARPLPVSPSTPSQPATVTITGDLGNEPVGESVQPGKYRTEGGTNCYWAVITKDRNGDITNIRNGFGGGPKTVTLKRGQDFQTVGCGTWTKVG